jgi:hypothetical protein
VTALSRLYRWVTGSGAGQFAERPEQDVAIDPGLASSRPFGGYHWHLSGDRGSVAGTGDTGEFVGRVAGDDLGYAGETGAEARAAAGEPTAAEPRATSPHADAPASGAEARSTSGQDESI